MHVVAQVEGLAAPGVHLNLRRVVARGLALVRLEIRGVFAVQSRVLIAHAGEVVEAV